MRAVPRLPDDEVNVSKKHPLGEFVLLSVGIGLVAVAIYALLAWSAEIAAGWVPLDVEVELFEALSLELPWPEIAAGDERAARLSALSARLAAHGPESPYVHQVFVLPEPAPNAFALPGGTILVTSGLLTEMDSENEVAFVLAHELGHFRHRDHLVTLGRAGLFRLLLAAIGIGGMPTGGLVEAGGQLAAGAYSREQERDADRFALQLLEAEYGHIGGATSSLERLTAGELLDVVGGYIGSHPGPSERIDGVLESARAQGFAVEGTLQPWDDTAAEGRRQDPSQLRHEVDEQRP